MNVRQDHESRLHPELRETVMRIQAAGGKPAHLQTSAEVRAAFLAARQPLRRDAQDLHIEDSTVDARHGPIPIRTYRPPADRGKPLAAFAYFHGGGFTNGDLDSHDAIACAIARQAHCMVASVDYRVLPEHRFPAAFDDAVAVLSWLPEWAERAGLARTDVAAGGDSSGANLAMAAALALAHQVPLRALWLAYPIIGADFNTPSYIENAEAPLLTRARCQRILADYVGRPLDDGDWRAAPLLAQDLSSLPTVVAIAAELDPLRSDAEILIQRLRQSAPRSTLVRAHGMPHGFLRWLSTSPAVAEVASASLQALRDALAPALNPPHNAAPLQ
ncbi:alpha/beta hydrolase [Hydrogenophaga sp. BPS33]|uniref:alpha/beta hydrolase n=1 Tax=Hydrogenophaga sp. BPS33 TaxID=2651974 RepID=UPI00131F6490|nr:alpha/beta hydrolase [Hydrogenophaga sp. BPS33]QHE85565.1 alpha/beta hydrolase [Hydrogenophaga sp. BPS33]